jgi:hypothetical protein
MSLVFGKLSVRLIYSRGPRWLFQWLTARVPHAPLGMSLWLLSPPWVFVLWEARIYEGPTFSSLQVGYYPSLSSSKAK